MKCMKVLVHQQPYKEILRNFGLEKLFSLRWSSSLWFLLGLICLWIATLEIVLPNHTWNMIISSKPCFVIIKIKINQTLVSHLQMSLSLRASKQKGTIGLKTEKEVIRHTRRPLSPYVEPIGEWNCHLKLIKLPLKLIELPLKPCEQIISKTNQNLSLEKRSSYH